MGKKATKKPADEEPEPEEEVYHVEVITKARVAVPSSDDEEDEDELERKKKKNKNKKKKKKNEDARWEYYVKWAGYDSDANTWEPAKNVRGCERLLQSFWDHVGTDDKDYEVGYEAVAQESWIKKEKAFFAKSFLNTKDERKKKKEKKRQRKDAKKSTSSGSRDTIEPSTASSSKWNSPPESDDDTPLSIALSAMSKKRKRPVLILSDDEVSPKEGGTEQAPPAKTMKLDEFGRKEITDKGKQRAELEPEPEQPEPPQPSSPSSLFSAPPSPAVSSPENSLQSTRPLLPSETMQPAPPSLPVKKNLAPVNTVKLPRRANNPHSRIPDMSKEKLIPNAGISTKQRLSLGALQPTLAKAPPPVSSSSQPKAPLPPIKTNSGSLSSISFKKKTGTPIVGASVSRSFSTPTTPQFQTPQFPTPQFPTPQFPGSHPTSQIAPPQIATPQNATPQMQPPIGTPAANIYGQGSASISPASAPSEWGNMLPEDYIMQGPPAESAYTGAAISSPAIFQQPGPSISSPITQADEFLRGIMPPAMAAPLTPAVDTNTGPLPPQPLKRRLLPIAGRIPKKWKWSGPLRLSSSRGQTEQICNTSFYDVTEPRPGGMRFSIALADVKNLDCLSFHDAADLGSILSACKPSGQLARLGPLETQDATTMETLVNYMGKHKKVILVPVDLNNDLVGHILLFPRNLPRLTRRFKVPGELLQPGSLIAALALWTLAPHMVARETRKPFSSLIPADIHFEHTMEPKPWKRSLRHQPDYQHGLRVLQFPLDVHHFLSEDERERPYCIWWDGGDGKGKHIGMETFLMHSVMEKYSRAKNVGYKADVRIIFVHIGALRTLPKLAAFMERRTKQPSIRFYTYGTHETMPRFMWGIKEIYPCGGVVTFTPSALLYDPLRALQLIKKINQHNLWVCYILPSVLGMVAKISCKDEDPIDALEKGTFPHRGILTAIEKGEVALIHSPPSHVYVTRSDDNRESWNDPLANWSKQYSTCLPLRPRKALEMGIAAFNAKLSNVPRSRWGATIEAEISNDLSRMQRNPAIMKDYRRYIVLKSDRDHNIAVNRDGFEWVTASKFDFRDDFFKQPTRNRRPK